MKKKLLTLLFAFTFGLSVLAGCNTNTEDLQLKSQDAGQSEDIEQSTNTISKNSESSVTDNAESHEKSSDYIWDDSDVISIELNGGSISTNSDDKDEVDVDDNKVKIESAGTYSISGTLDDGQIVVDTKDDEIVQLILDGVDINCSSGPAIYIKKAEKAIIILADNTENTLADGESYDASDDSDEDSEEDESKAALFSKADLTIYSNNNGSLTVNGNSNDGISSKDGLVIKNATITANAEDDGINGKDYVIVTDSKIEITSEGDGLKSGNSTDADCGYIAIESGEISISAGGDAITAETDVIITGGTIDLISGGGSENGTSKSEFGGMMRERTTTTTTTEDDVSTKGIKAGVSIIIDNGNLTIDSADDSIHSNGTLVINSGSFDIASGDDGMHSDTSLEINGGDISITKSYEGIESSLITINDGNINIVASDDGINVAGGTDGSGMMGGRGDMFNSGSNDYHLYINGGYIYMNAGGDGLDSNGTIEMTGGVAIVDGPTNSGNGAIDYMNSFNITGGFLIAAGSSGMAEAPTEESAQYSVLVNFDSAQTAGTLINIQSSTGESILTFAPAKTYQSIVLSSADIKEGETYTLYLGGSTTGTEENGLYEDGIYTPGTEYISLTISSITTKEGSGGMMGGGMGGGMDRGTRNNTSTTTDTQNIDMGDMTPPDMGEMPEMGDMIPPDMGEMPDMGNMTPPDAM